MTKLCFSNPSHAWAYTFLETSRKWSESTVVWPARGANPFVEQRFEGLQVQSLPTLSFPLNISILPLPSLFFSFFSSSFCRIPVRKSRDYPILAHPETPLCLMSEPSLIGSRSQCADMKKLAFKRTITNLSPLSFRRNSLWMEEGTAAIPGEDSQYSWCSSCIHDWSQNALGRESSPGNWELAGEGQLFKCKWDPVGFIVDKMDLGRWININRMG